MTSSMESVQLGMSALQAGDRNTARAHFRAAILSNPRNEDAWLWMAAAVADQKERHYCLGRVLALNPNNPVAQRGLAELTADADAPTIALLSDGNLWAASAQTVSVGGETLLAASAPTVVLNSSNDLFSSTRVASLPPPASALLDLNDSPNGGDVPFYALSSLTTPTLQQEGAVYAAGRSKSTIIALTVLITFCLLLLSSVFWLLA
jgi:hypothetical protein